MSNDPAFDFHGMVDWALTHFPAALGDTVFADIRNARRFGPAFSGYDFHGGMTNMAGHVFFDCMIAAGYNGALVNRRSMAERVDGNTRALVLGADDAGIPASVRDDLPLYLFLHELGHLVMPDAFDATVDPAQRENRADAFAAAFFLHLRPQSRATVEAICDKRRREAATGDGRYNTAASLGKVLAEDALDSRSPRDVLAMALAAATEAPQTSPVPVKKPLFAK